jgi:hypothetical protein
MKPSRVATRISPNRRTARSAPAPLPPLRREQYRYRSACRRSLTDPGWFQAGHEETFASSLSCSSATCPSRNGRGGHHLPNLFSLNHKDTDEGRPESRLVDVFRLGDAPGRYGYVPRCAITGTSASHTPRAQCYRRSRRRSPPCLRRRHSARDGDRPFRRDTSVQITRGLVEAWLRRVEERTPGMHIWA